MALNRRLIPQFIGILIYYSARSVDFSIMNAHRCSRNMDKFPLLIISLEEEVISLFVVLLNMQSDSEPHHQIVKEVSVLPWISQDQPIPSQDMLGSGILSFSCSDLIQWPSLNILGNESMASSKDI